MNQFAGSRVALVTGASRGIGAATALALARRCITPMLAVRNPGAAGAALEAIGQAGARAHAVACDVADIDSVRHAIAECLHLAGRLDIVVNNAGQIEPIGRVGETDPLEWLKAITVNLAGPYNVVHAALPALEKSSSAAIVNISSGAAHTPREGWSAYCSGKAALAMLTRSLALEYPQVATYGFQPGVVDTEMQVRIRASGINEISRIPRDKLAQPDRPADFIAWLCDARPADLVGQDLTVNDAALQARVERDKHAEP